MTLAAARPLYDAEGMRELDARALRLPGRGDGMLMETAGFALWEALRKHFPAIRVLGILCGPGNNGGDGFVLARLAREAGWQVIVHASDASSRAPADAQRARARWCEGGGQIEELEGFAPDAAELWVDCLFGIGMNAAPRAPYAALIERLNRSARPVMAADVPSGVDSSTGNVPGVAVRAVCTVTMIADKPGLHTGPAVDHVGAVEVADLGLPATMGDGVESVANRLTLADTVGALPRCHLAAHKGDFGDVLVLGGAPGYSGAARLSARAALRAGAGRVTLLTHPEHAAFANIDRPELMVRAIREPSDLPGLLVGNPILVVGPGLGLDAWGRRLWTALADRELPMVVDADALTWLARFPRYSSRWILTPHPGEAARLLGISAQEINADRVAAVRALQRRYGGVVLLKGAGTLVCGEAATKGFGQVFCLDRGCPGMATAGMGDVLAGLLGALLARGLGDLEAACFGGNWHIAAAQLALRQCKAARGALAAEVADHLPEAMFAGVSA
jgi:hydroxyethylthiazole kinase-like uncharacterized protein yjeF